MHGQLQPLDLPLLGPAETKALAYSVLTDAQKKRFEETLELDFSFGIRGIARFRCNVFNQRGAVAAVYRVIPEIDQAVRRARPAARSSRTLAERPRGLVLVTGPTGSGKSTTLAAMIDKINTERREHILTIEDPIEFVHQHKGCLVNQREVHADTHGFAAALRAALREDPDIVLIGELRDLETIESALRIAETGHLDVRDAAHQLGGADDQPHHRRLPGAPAGADPHAAVAGARGHRLSGAAAARRRQGARRRARDHGADAGDPQPDPRRQGAPDLLDDADRPGKARDADDEPVPGHAVSEAADHARERRWSASSLKDELEQMISRGAGVVAGRGDATRPGCRRGTVVTVTAAAVRLRESPVSGPRRRRSRELGAER